MCCLEQEFGGLRVTTQGGKKDTCQCGYYWITFLCAAAGVGDENSRVGWWLRKAGFPDLASELRTVLNAGQVPRTWGVLSLFFRVCLGNEHVVDSPQPQPAKVNGPRVRLPTVSDANKGSK